MTEAQDTNEREDENASKYGEEWKQVATHVLMWVQVANGNRYSVDVAFGSSPCTYYFSFFLFSFPVLRPSSQPAPKRNEIIHPWIISLRSHWSWHSRASREPLSSARGQAGSISSVFP